MKDPIELDNALAQFYGTERWYQHGLNPEMTYTDGVKFFAENAGNGAYWMLDIVASALMKIQTTQDQSFIHIALDVKDDAAVMNADDGNDNPLWQRKIEFTDCPAGYWEFYLIDGVMLLPSEY